MNGAYPPTIGQGNSGKKVHSLSHIFSGSLFNSTSGGTRLESVGSDAGNCELMDHGMLNSNPDGSMTESKKEPEQKV